MTLEFVLYKNNTKEPLKVPANEGIEEVNELLTTIKNSGLTCRTVDTNKISEEERQEAYLEAVTPSVFKKYRIRQIFGSRRESASFFGKGVPAFLVYEDGRIKDVYPHEERGRIITIREYLEKLAKN